MAGNERTPALPYSWRYREREREGKEILLSILERGREMETGKVVAEAEELPKAIVRRVVKDTLSRCSPEDSDINIHKDALLAFSESARIFIHYLTATANDICKESKRQTMNAGDVFKALEDIEFPEFVGPLKVSLNDFKRKNGGKKEGSSPNKEVQKKRKTGGKSTPKKGDTGEK